MKHMSIDEAMRDGTIHYYPDLFVENNIFPTVMEIIGNYIDSFHVSKEQLLDNLRLSCSVNDFYCCVDAKVIFNDNGIKEVKATSIDHIILSISVDYKDCLVGTIKIKYDKGVVNILNMEEFIILTNKFICSTCKEHTSKCRCHKPILVNNDYSNETEKYVEGQIMKEDFYKNLKFTTDSVFNDKTGLTRRIPYGESTEDKKETGIDLEQYEDLFLGIVKTMGMKITNIRNAAKVILANNPNVSEQNLTTEIIKTCRGS